MVRTSTDHENYWDLVKRIIKESDVVLEILDARLVEFTRNDEVEKIIKEQGRPLIHVVNKSDFVSKDKIKKQIKDLENVVFVSIREMKTIKILLMEIKKMFRKHGKRDIPKKDKFSPKNKVREAKADIVVGVLGYPNVGKSSIINAISHKKKAKVGKKSGTTHGLQWVRATDEIKLIDSPGVIPLEERDEAFDALIGAKDSERLKNPELVAVEFLKMFRNNIEDVEENYKVRIENENPEEIIREIGLKKGHLIKGGEPDVNRTSKMLIRDWQKGKLRL